MHYIFLFLFFWALNWIITEKKLLGFQCLPILLSWKLWLWNLQNTCRKLTVSDCVYFVLVVYSVNFHLLRNWVNVIQCRHRPIYQPGRYLGFTDISVSAKTADIIGLSRRWQNAVIFLTHPDNLRKKTQRSKSRQLSCSNASRCGSINKQTRWTMEHASVVAAETKASGSFAMLAAYRLYRAPVCRCYLRINCVCASRSFRSTKSLTVTSGAEVLSMPSLAQINDKKLAWKMNCVKQDLWRCEYDYRCNR